MAGRQRRNTEAPGVTIGHTVDRIDASGDGSQNPLCGGVVN